MKLAAGKMSLPGRKQVFRFFEDDRAAGDVIARADEDLGGTPLLECVMRGGVRTEAGRRSLDDARARAEAGLAALPERLHALDVAEPPYPVELSEGLRQRIEQVRQALAEETHPA